MTTTDRDIVDSTPPIVVGVDGSPSSKAALAWAARQAELSHVPLLVVSSWRSGTSYGWPSAEAIIEDCLTEVLGPDPGIDIGTLVLEGHPAPVLTEQSKTASLIVVGSRGRGEFAGMLLGSVSEFLSTHAHCPVLIVRDQGT